MPIWLTTAISILVPILLGLIGWGLNSQIKLLRNEFKEALAEAELRFYGRVNGTYVRTELLNARFSALPCGQCTDRKMAHPPTFPVWRQSL